MAFLTVPGREGCVGGRVGGCRKFWKREMKERRGKKGMTGECREFEKVK